MNDKLKMLLVSADPPVAERWLQSLASSEAEKLRADDWQGMQGLLQTGGIDLVLLDLNLPELTLGQTLDLIQSHRESFFIVFARRPSNAEGLWCVRGGARAYCNCYIGPELLERVVALVMAGEIWLGASIMEELIRNIPLQKLREEEADPLAELTERERQVALLVASGESNKRIAQQLDISERTVKAHLSAIFHKTEARDRLQLALLVKAVI